MKAKPIPTNWSIDKCIQFLQKHPVTYAMEVESLKDKTEMMDRNSCAINKSQKSEEHRVFDVVY